MAPSDAWLWWDRWLPVKGRPVVCRRPGCLQAAVDSVVQLCAGHRGSQPRTPLNLRFEEQERRRGSRDLPGAGPWAARASCRDAPGVNFFSEDLKAKAGRVEGERAKAVCLTCPVRLLCLAAGLDETDGIWGGLSPVERRKLRKAMRRGAA